MDTSLNKGQHNQELLCEKYLALVLMCMCWGTFLLSFNSDQSYNQDLGRLTLTIDITPLNNLDMVTFEFLLAWDFVSTKAQPH
jgi:hypothetical protein